jgi:hypothetical protein
MLKLIKFLPLAALIAAFILQAFLYYDTVTPVLPAILPV